MNKKDIANFRRQFKVNNDLLKINDIFNIYILKETSEIFHQESVAFELLEDEQKELFMGNFKKVLSGQIDQKLFTLKFKRDVEDSSQLILHQGLISNDSDEWKEQMVHLVEKMIKDRRYEKDVVVTFIRGEYMKPMKGRSDATEEIDRDTVYSHPFILCSINNTQEPKKELMFDYIEKEFKYSFHVDPVINLKRPLSGFLFPCFIDNASDVNHVLYSAKKAYELDYHFIEEVLNAEEVMTASEDKIVFEEVVKKVTGDQMNTSTLSKVYEEIHQRLEESAEDEEIPTIYYRDVQEVLESSGIKDVERENVANAFETVINDKTFELKANNVIPKYTSKSIRIKTKIANISISPQDLKYVRQVEVDGKLCLMIEVEENTIIEGFEMMPETLLGEKNE